MESERLMNSFANKVLALQKQTEAAKHDSISFFSPPVRTINAKIKAALPPRRDDAAASFSLWPPVSHKVTAAVPLTSGQPVSLYFWRVGADCLCTLISGLRAGQIYRTAWRQSDRAPLASSFPGCHYARVRYSGILIPMPLHFAITITRYSPGLRVPPDLCRLAIYISSKCFSIPAAEGLRATQMDMRTFAFYATPVVLQPLMPLATTPSHPPTHTPA